MGVVSTPLCGRWVYFAGFSRQNIPKGTCIQFVFLVNCIFPYVYIKGRMMNAQQENMAANIIASISRVVVTAVCVTMVTTSHQMADTVKV